MCAGERLDQSHVRSRRAAGGAGRIKDTGAPAPKLRPHGQDQHQLSVFIPDGLAVGEEFAAVVDDFTVARLRR